MRSKSATPRKFDDRQDAGRQLAHALLPFAGSPGLLVLGLPRGGVPVAAEISAALSCPLDVVLVRKIGVPGFDELAMGAVATAGGSLSTVRNERVIAGLTGDGNAAFEAAIAPELVELARREELYRAGLPPLEIAGRTIVIVDDGVATGATLRAALHAVRQLRPAQLWVAAPVFLGHSLAGIRPLADQTFWLWDAASLGSVGQAYHQFGQVPDDEVQRLLLRPPE
ncbi:MULTISPECIES: phosphoribosyltransferase [unclassified Arthrobacter]|uniref:phosphoribosyltransferase n=1 Tax=unclassified Arthrobacter TaxID=235627 RepID=UPI0002D90C7F|nr:MULTISPECIES: phosphoribosyltransferase family protein [unclassified Arthrobacter]PVE19581.1 phosphoribosyltransferase [Arthrobacter sp. Bz4]